MSGRGREDPDLDRAAVEAVNAELYAAFEAGDLDRMGMVWDDGDVACVHPGWLLLRGRAEVLRSWAVIMANTSYIQFFLTDVRTEVSGDVAVLTCAENILTADDDAEAGSAGGFADSARVMTTNVFWRTADGWRLRLHHGSPVLAPPGPTPEEP